MDSQPHPLKPDVCRWAGRRSGVARVPARVVPACNGRLGDVTSASEPSPVDLESLVGEWLSVPDAAELLGVPLSRVRQLIADREVLTHRIGERNVVAIPAKFLEPSGPRPELKGTFTVLGDGGLRDDEIIEWLYTPDPSLPVDGAPIDALRAGHKTEIRRRAQELSF